MAVLILGILVIGLLLYSFIMEMLVRKNSDKHTAKVVKHAPIQHADKKGDIVRQSFKISLSVYGRTDEKDMVEALSRHPEKEGEILEIYENRKTGKITLAKDMLTTSPIRMLLMLGFGGFLLFFYFYRINMLI